MEKTSEKLRKHELEIISLVGAAVRQSAECKTTDKLADVIIKTSHMILDVVENDVDNLRKQLD